MTEDKRREVATQEKGQENAKHNPETNRWQTRKNVVKTIISFPIPAP
jgi:hypothetical protein